MSQHTPPLECLLADTYTLYLKTQNFHWNVEGSDFLSLHHLFEEHYTDLAEAVDEIAERLRTFGAYAPGSFARFLALTSLKEAPDAPPSAHEMVRLLAADHHQLAKTAQTALEAASEEEDEGTVDLCTTRLRVHQKAAWMLDSLNKAS